MIPEKVNLAEISLRLFVGINSVILYSSGIVEIYEVDDLGLNHWMPMGSGCWLETHRCELVQQGPVTWRRNFGDFKIAI
jgi:hypothetical protein